MMQQHFLSRVAVLALTATMTIGSAVMAQLPVGDLRVWLKADDLVTAGLNDGDPVDLWTDASSFGTTFEPDLTIESAPKLEVANINGNIVPTVRFTASGPGSDPANTRLRQTSNLDTVNPTNDPTNIADGSDMTLFAVFNPTHTTTPLLNFQTLAGKRGAGGSPWTFGWQDGAGGANQGQFAYVTFAGGLPWRSGNFANPIPENKWHVSAMQITELGANDAITFFDDPSEDANQGLVDLGAVDGNNPPFGNPVDPLTGANGPARNGPIPEGMLLGGHLQPGPGPGERFDGNLAELIIFANKLSPQDFTQVESYLNQKYFAAIPEPTTSLLALVAVAPLVFGGRRRRLLAADASNLG